jgi:hypothetical protein
MDRLLRPLADKKDAPDIFTIIFLGGAGGFFLLRAWRALENWRTPGILSRPQRMEQLSFSILEVVVATYLLGILGFWLADSRPTESRFAIWWIYLLALALLAAGGVEVIASLTRYRERRSRMRAFREAGLRPKRFVPMAFIIAMWLMGIFVAVPLTGLLILVLNPRAVGQGEIPSWAIPAAAGAQFLVLSAGIIHYVIARRRRRVDEKRLIAEYRSLLWRREGSTDGPG